MKIRLARTDDLPVLMDIVHEAQRTIAQLGIDQWQNGYPSEEVIACDIAMGRSYVVEQGSDLVGTFVLVETEPAYERIYEGHWHWEDYIAIHRVAVKVTFRGKGVADAIIRCAEDHAKRMGHCALRIDTHHGNLPMRRMLEKQGFRACGVIYLSDGAARVAYEKSVW